MKRKILVGILIALMITTILPALPIHAATYVDITVTATPAYVTITTSNTTWTINDIVNAGVIDPDTIYYSNPVGDTTSPSATVAANEGYFGIENDSSVNINIVADMEDFSGGDANMANSETGSNGATDYGAYSYYEGMTYSGKVVVKTNATGSDTLWTSSSPGDDIDIGIEIETQSNAWAGSSSSTSTLKVSAETA